VEKLISKSFERLVDKGLNRGFITHDELQKSLGKRNSNFESLNNALIHIFDKAITLVVNKSDFKIKCSSMNTDQIVDKIIIVPNIPCSDRNSI